MPTPLQKRKLMGEINVVPYIDVMLVLLVIFMVTAPLMTQGVEVDLPVTKTVKNLPQDKDHLVLTVKKGGEMYLEMIFGNGFYHADPHPGNLLVLPGNRPMVLRKIDRVHETAIGKFTIGGFVAVQALPQIFFRILAESGRRAVEIWASVVGERHPDYLAGLRNLRVPVADQISIIEELQRTGALHAEIIRE
mgnify:CR=1 FL=1